MLMRITKCVKFALPMACVGLLMLGAAQPVLATILGPYTADSNTLHLWHMNESGNDIEDYGYADGGDIDAQVSNGAALGAATYAGFGTAVNVASGSNIVHAATQPATQSQLQGSNGAFTYEAIIKVGSITQDESQAIVSLSGGTDYADQAFQFRISGGQMQFVAVKPSVAVIAASIPTTGDDAFSGDNWYHAAATYTGAEGVADNVKLYWTKVGDGRVAANLIGTGTLVSDVTATQTNYLSIGNRYTTGVAVNGEDCLRGSIDEVRISDVARGSDEFMFGVVPEPGTFVLLVAGLLGLLAYAWRRQK